MRSVFLVSGLALVLLACSDDTSINASHHYVLVDDVFTTGSTLNGCARVLRHAGAVNLDVVTFGHG